MRSTVLSLSALPRDICMHSRRLPSAQAPFPSATARQFGVRVPALRVMGLHTGATRKRRPAC
eukprot:13766910-Alexandrium_andersonii.AAC.1